MLQDSEWATTHHMSARIYQGHAGCTCRHYTEPSLTPFYTAPGCSRHLRGILALDGAPWPRSYCVPHCLVCRCVRRRLQSHAAAHRIAALQASLSARLTMDHLGRRLGRIPANRRYLAECQRSMRKTALAHFAWPMVARRQHVRRDLKRAVVGDAWLRRAQVRAPSRVPEGQAVSLVW